MFSFLSIFISFFLLRSYNTEELKFSRYVWSFYDRKMPDIIQRIFDRTYNIVSKNWEYKYLTYDNISLYLNTSLFPSHFKKMLPAHQSDYVRLCLLSKYGGWWIDTAIIVNNDSIMEEMYEEGKESNAELVGVCYLQCPRKLIETSFFYAPKGSVILKEWMKEFAFAEEIGESNYLYKIYREGITFPQITFGPKYPFIDPYMVVFGAQQKALDRNIARNTSMVIHPAVDSIFKLINECNRNPKCINKTLNNKEKVKEYRVIKMNSWLRRKLFPKGKTVTAYDPFYEPHPLIAGMKISNKDIITLCLSLFFYIIGLYTLRIASESCIIYLKILL